MKGYIESDEDSIRKVKIYRMGEFVLKLSDADLQALKGLLTNLQAVNDIGVKLYT